MGGGGEGGGGSARCVVERRFAANVLSCHVVTARPDETMDKLEQFPNYRVVAELAGLNTFRGGLFNTEKIRMVAALAGLNTFRGIFLILQKSARWQH